MCEARDNEVGVIIEDFLPSFAFVWRVAGDVVGEVSWGHRGLDGLGLKTVVVIADTVNSIIACFSESINRENEREGCYRD